MILISRLWGEEWYDHKGVLKTLFWVSFCFVHFLFVLFCLFVVLWGFFFSFYLLCLGIVPLCEYLRICPFSCFPLLIGITLRRHTRMIPGSTEIIIFWSSHHLSIFILLPSPLSVLVIDCNLFQRYVIDCKTLWLFKYNLETTDPYNGRVQVFFDVITDKLL